MNIRLLISVLPLFCISACHDQVVSKAHSDHPHPSTAKVKVPTAKKMPAQATTEPVRSLAALHSKIFLNGNIYTVNEKQPNVEAVVVRGRKIINLGSAAQMREQYSNAQVIDLGGATLIPGLIDAHGHLLGLGESLLNVDLTGTQNKAEIIQRLKTKAAELTDDQWLLGRGWDQNDWPTPELPTKADLDEAFPTRPVWLERVDGHANWGNSAAIKFSDRNLSGHWQIDGGEIIRDGNQNPTGVFIDNAVSIIQSKVPTGSDDERMIALETAMKKTAEVGLTGMHDAGTSLKTWRLLNQLHDDRKLKIRVYSMANGAQEMLDYLCEQGSQVDALGMLTARSIKLYSDGALGSRGAALITDYSDDPGNKGLLVETQQTLTKHVNKAIHCGLQVNIHAIGDRGNKVTLDVLTQASAANDNPGRHRIEHAQVVAPADFQRFKKLGLIASVQPTHATSDMYWAEERVGAERIKGAYAWRQFLDFGIPLALGSDFPIERPDPLHGFYAAVTRQDHQQWPKGGWRSKEKLTRKEALYGFTLGAAYAAFQEDSVGSIEVGKYADFTVLSKDIMQIPETEILSTNVTSTYINGEAVYRAFD